MRIILQHQLKRASTWQLVILTVVTSVIITTCLSSLISYIGWGQVSLEVLIIGTIDASLVPVIIAPLLIKLVKHNLQLADLIQALQQEVTERKRAETEAQQQAESLLAVNQLAIDCAAAGPEVDLLALIGDTLRTISNALAVSVSTYDAQTSTLTVRYLSIPGPLLATVNRLLGRDVIGMQMRVSAEMHQQMVTEVVSVSQDLTEVTFGVIPKPLAAVIQTTFNIAGFIGLAFHYGGELVGSAVIVTRHGQKPLSPELADVLAHVGAVSLQRKQAEEALRASEERLRSFIEQSQEAVNIVDERGRIIEWNGACERLSGLARADVLGKYYWDILFNMLPREQRTEEQHTYLKQQLNEALRTGRPSFTGPAQFEYERTDGQRTVVEQVMFPMKTAQGYRFGSIVNDVTERRQAEAEREALIKELEAKNTELERFTYTVSHDLKSPLITIAGFAAFLEKDALAGKAEQVKADIHYISEATDKMGRLLDDLLELSRIGRLIDPPEHIPLAAIVTDALTLVHGRLAERGVMVSVADNLPTVYGDRARLVEVVQNLVDNAAKFMGDQPQPYIEIGLREQEGEQIFFVRDNGLGIEPQYQQKVFGLFDKLDKKTEGTGIGLALVKRIVEVHGGRIWVESAGQGQGATFCFILPTMAPNTE